MSSILDMLGEQLGGANLGAVSRQIGSDEKSTGAALSAALPLLLGALSRNASRPEGAASLDGALSRDHGGDLLDNVSGFLGGAQAGPGDGILRHVLGERRGAVEKGVSRASGMDAGSVSKLLVTVAPLVMAALGREKKQKGLDAAGLAGLLGQEKAQIEQRTPQAGNLLSGLLDSDGDGDVDLSDLVRGAGTLGKLFGGGR